jgi:glycosyltransferase 2 family protein
LRTYCIANALYKPLIVKKIPYGAVVRPLLGLLLIIFLVRQLDQAKLWALVDKISWNWFLLACLALIISNLFSVARWQKITEQMGLPIQFKQALYLYAQGITANTVLPGGIVGGDVLRTLGLVNIANQQNRPGGFAHAEAAASVLLDRVGGLWSLCIFSLLSLLALMMMGATEIKVDVLTPRGLWYLKLYSIVLILSVLAPLLFSVSWLSASQLKTWDAQTGNKWLRKFIQTLGVISANIHQLVATLKQSLLVQIFAVLALYCCLRAVGVVLPYFVVAALSLAIFLSAIIPASVSGFGARELAAVAVLGIIGVNAESAFSASFLFGLAGTLQGMMGIYFWLKKQSL